MDVEDSHQQEKIRNKRNKMWRFCQKIYETTYYLRLITQDSLTSKRWTIKI